LRGFCVLLISEEVGFEHRNDATSEDVAVRWCPENISRRRNVTRGRIPPPQQSKLKPPVDRRF